MRIRLKGIIRDWNKYTQDELDKLPDNFTSHPVWLNGDELDLGESLKVSRHSPSGFNWGYSGSGPSQLALAICIKLFGEVRARNVYTDFKNEFISSIPFEKEFDIELDITGFIQSHQSTFIKADQDYEQEQIFLKEIKELEEEERKYFEQHPEEAAAVKEQMEKRKEKKPDTIKRLSKIKPIRFSYKIPNRSNGICNIIVSKENSLVIASEIHDNTGASITNTAEYVAIQVCEAYEINPKKLIWIEHYSDNSYISGRSREDFDLVKFKYDSDKKFHDPQWMPLSQEEIEEYVKLLD